ncbi:hypothetical protein WJX74_008415 [Apatococcus lobatus]|uniref:Uncharacterized protein n=1 Tax=Apatococcus lobatus TaxID=904363 RepID=A0AAW1RUD2_9CHLO
MRTTAFQLENEAELDAALQDVMDQFEGQEAAGEAAAPPSQPQSLQPEPFASGANLDACIQFLNSALAGQNLPGPLHLRSSEEEHIAGTCNAFHSLLQLRQQEAQVSSACKDQMVRLRSDLSLAEAGKARLQGQLDAKEREICSHLHKARFSKLSYEDATSRLSSERDELHRQNAGLQRQQAQVQHELKRKDREYERLQDRLRDLLTEKKREAKVAPEAATAIHAEVAAGSHSRPTRAHEKAAVQAAIAGYEAKQTELQQEADSLRSALHSLQQEHCNLVNQRAPSAANTAPSAARAGQTRRAANRKPAAMLPDDPDGLMQLPKGHLQGLLGSRLAQLKRRTSLLAADGLSAEEVTSPQEQKLLRDLEGCHTLIQEQELLVTMAMDALSREQTAGPAMSSKADNAEQLSKIASPRRQQQAAAAQADQADLKIRELEAQLWVAEQKAAAAEASLETWRIAENGQQEEQRAHLLIEADKLQTARADFRAQQDTYRDLLKRMAPGFGAGHFLEVTIRKAAQQANSKSGSHIGKGKL